MCVTAIPAEKPSVIKGILSEYVIQKVEYMQELVKFDAIHTKRLQQIELAYLLKVQKVENCFLCNKAKKIEKLKAKKYKAIEEILSPNEFIKYKALDNNEIEKHPLWAD